MQNRRQTLAIERYTEYTNAMIPIISQVVNLLSESQRNMMYLTRESIETPPRRTFNTNGGNINNNEHFNTTYFHPFTNSTSQSATNSNTTTPSNTDFFHLLEPFIIQPNTTPIANLRTRRANVNNATRALRYDQIPNPSDEICPITRERFNADDVVIQIIHCGHCFKGISLLQWLNNNNHCPVCRYDIRDSVDISNNAQT